MNFLTDFHHGQLAVSLYLLFARRLGFNMYILDDPKAHDVFGFNGKSFGGAHPEYADGFHSLTTEQLGEVPIDLFLPTVPINDVPFQELQKKYYPKAALLAQAGNENMYHNEECKNVITSAYEVERWYKVSRKKHRVLVYYPEIDLAKFSYKGPPTREFSKTIRCYMPCLKGGECGHFYCRYCKKKPPFLTPKDRVNLGDVFEAARNEMGTVGIQLKGHGMSSFDENLSYGQIPEKIEQSSLTWHYKVTEGWGFSALSSLVCGRPVLTHPFWLMGATISDFLIQDRTALFAKFDVPTIHRAIARYVGDYNYVCELCERTHQISKTLFDYEYEAHRVKRFLEGVL